MTLAVNKSERQTMIASNVGAQTVIGKFRQRQNEVITYEIDYSGWLASGETISTASYALVPTTSPAGVIINQTISGGNKLLFQFDNGTEGTRYVVEVLITTSTGQAKSDTFSVTIGTFSVDAAQADVATASSAAIAARDAAQLSATQAATSATNAANSATGAASSLAAIGASATNAANSAAAAATSAANAANSATAAATSATNAAASASTATTKAAEATSATSTAAGHASTASTQATNAATSATNAAGSASAAASSATSAAASASSASSSATTATTKASEASSSATNAANSAATATTKASDAATSASDASNSATAAATSAGNAATSATNAATSATNASGSASAAASARTAAESARDATLAAYDSFDDRYLGVKSTDPTLDNDGNALVAGSLYFSSTDNAMKVYTGSAWVAAYVSGAGTLLAANNLFDLSSISQARTNLGLAIGTNVQAWDGDLDAIAALAGTSGLLKKTGANTWTLDTSAYLTSVTKADIGLGNVENTALSTWAGSANITTLGTVTTGTWSGSTIAVNKGGTGATDAATARSNLGLGSAAVQATADFAAAVHSHVISDVTGLQTALDAKAAASHTHVATDITDSTAAGRSVLTAADAAAQRTALGLGSAATQSTQAIANTVLAAIPDPVAMALVFGS